jgi:hypothetical protein
LYYLSADITKKTFWPLILISESLRFTAINNFRIIFAFFWMGIALKTSVNFYFASAFICGNILNKVKRINIIGTLYISFLPTTLMIGEATIRSRFIEMVIGKITVFNILYMTIIVFLIFTKKGVRNETE